MAKVAPLSAEQWATVLSAAADPVAVPDRDAVLRTAMELGRTVAESTVGCSVTERIGMTFLTPVASSRLAVQVDEVQYDADAGPCLDAARRGEMHRIDVMSEESAYPAFAAAAVRHGVRSSLSLPLPDLGRPAALNLYSATVAAFAPERSRAVAHLLARCVESLLQDAPGPAPSDGDLLSAALARRARVNRARNALIARDGSSPQDAFEVLVRRSKAERRSLADIAEDVLRETGPGTGA
jgi:hypothetical protein